MFADYRGRATACPDGLLRVLGSGGPGALQRRPIHRRLPKQGFPDFAVSTWYGLVAPAKTPSDVLVKLSSALSKIRRMPDVRTRLDQLGYDRIEDSPAQFRAVINSEIDRYSKLVKRTGLKLN